MVLQSKNPGMNINVAVLKHILFILNLFLQEDNKNLLRVGQGLRAVQTWSSRIGLQSILLQGLVLLPNTPPSSSDSAGS